MVIQASHRLRKGKHVDTDADVLAEAPPDEGCEVASSCFRCPLPQCKHDDPLWHRRFQQYRYYRALAAAVMDYSENRDAAVQQVAQQHGLTSRSLYRILRRMEQGKEEEFERAYQAQNSEDR